MKLDAIAEKLDLEDLMPEVPLEEDVEVSNGYASDLLSDVLAHAPRGGVLVTIQIHMNVAAVATHAGLAAVIFASDRAPDEAVVKKAVDEHVRLYTSEKSTFDIVGQLYAMGLRGRNE